MWTFNENTGKWVNDVANWNQKWELIDGAVCLQNTAIEPETSSDDMPWLALKPKEAANVAKNTKAPLWSPPISEAAGMRCITLDYAINVEDTHSGFYGLAVLQHQDG